MSMKFSRTRCGVLSGLFGLCATLGCGGTDPKPAGGTAAAGAAAGGSSATRGLPLLPWAEGNSWTYDVTSGGMTAPKTTSIGAEEAVGGMGPNATLMAFHVTTDKGQNDHTESWQAPDPAEPLRILRYREQAFGAATGALKTEDYWDPAKLHVDGSAAHTTSGANWQETYGETKLVVGMPPTKHDVTDDWSVVEGDASLSVVAGSFDHVVHFRKMGTSIKDYWYARGVGKLKETGSQTEELTEYSVAP